jgi:hypothetical protein
MINYNLESCLGIDQNAEKGRVVWQEPIMTPKARQRDRPQIRHIPEHSWHYSQYGKAQLWSCTSGASTD